jgi:F0F1-type ATP synthase membrane subunit c/vacuolar-type H+-ATPase subunit K
MDILKKLQIDRLLGFLLTLAVPGIIVWKLAEYILESPTRKQAAIYTIFIEALALFVFIRIAMLAGFIKRRKSS